MKSGYPLIFPWARIAELSVLIDTTEGLARGTKSATWGERKGTRDRKEFVLRVVSGRCKQKLSWTIGDECWLENWRLRWLYRSVSFFFCFWNGRRKKKETELHWKEIRWFESLRSDYQTLFVLGCTSIKESRWILSVFLTPVARDRKGSAVNFRDWYCEVLCKWSLYWIPFRHENKGGTK